MTRIYGKWAGNPKGTKEDPTRCIEAVRSDPWISCQCSRKRGFGPDGLYCKQHDPDAAARRKAETEAREQRQWASRMIEANARRMALALRQIADGHNDPRGLATETIANVRRYLDTLGK